ncbi:MAG: sigma-54-dependent Fis family transcriptional regulator, partial [Candidatus Tectomicrobia bacterium]|nr:sigma-54-dependent Fis family transcriptional regulator [Candidatus Tectomicrobia bacterium]
MAKKPMILIINDQQEAVDLLRFQLEKERYQVVTALDGETGVKRARSKHPDLVLLDLKMPPSNSTDEGMRALKRLRDHDHDLPILILTAIGRKEEAVKAVQMGAFDFLRVEEIEEKLLIAVRNALDYRRLREENRTLRQTMERLGDVRIVGQSEKILTVLEMIGDVADSEATILVRGASGTGKELVSRFIHLRSRRRDEPFVTVNCAAIPSTLLESELFGYERGAFTGASRSKEGKFLLAHKGTIFLDEVGELHLDIQAKLLRVLEQREIEPLGGKRPIKVDIRVIAATNRNLEDAVASKQFREDLYYRLNVVPIELPTLRERREDIPLLLDYFLKKYS